MLKKLEISSWLIIALLGCTNIPYENSDVTLTKEMAFEKIKVTVNNQEEVVFNVSDLEGFNFVQVLIDNGLFVAHHEKKDSLLVISRTSVTQMDTVRNPLGPFKKGYEFSLILGNKYNDDPEDIGMQGMVAFDILIK